MIIPLDAAPWLLGMACEEAWSVLPADILDEAETVTVRITVRRSDGSCTVGEKKVPAWEIHRFCGGTGR